MLFSPNRHYHWSCIYVCPWLHGLTARIDSTDWLVTLAAKMSFPLTCLRIHCFVSIIVHQALINANGCNSNVTTQYIINNKISGFSFRATVEILNIKSLVKSKQILKFHWGNNAHLVCILYYIGIWRIINWWQFFLYGTYHLPGGLRKDCNQNIFLCFPRDLFFATEFKYWTFHYLIVYKSMGIENKNVINVILHCERSKYKKL